MKKILLYCNFGKYPITDYRKGLYNTLDRNKKVELGHVPLGGNKFALKYNAFNPDIVISIKGWIPEKLKRKNCIFIHLQCDDPDEFFNHEPHMKEFDYWFTNSKWSELFQHHKNGYKKVKTCAFAQDQKFFEKVPFNKLFEHDVMFAGHHIPYRHSFLNGLAGLDVGVYGSGWRESCVGFTGKKLIDMNYFMALKSSKMCIDFSLSGSNYLNVKEKTFEITGVGSLLLCNQFSEMRLYYKYDKECVGFVNEKDLREKVDYYLEHEDEREEIAKAGRKRFLKDHTWEKRLKYVFKECNIKL